MEGGVFKPDYVTIGDKRYGLRCVLDHEPPIVDAGNNISILSQQQPSTVIIGTASDPDVGDIRLIAGLKGQHNFRVGKQ